MACRLPAAMPDDPGAPLREAASQGQTARVSTWLTSGLPIDAADAGGRTALMLAAQQGRAEVVRLLLSKGANAGARDRRGFTAWGLATFAPSGHRSHEAALKALPQPVRPRVALHAGWTPARLFSSCFMGTGELRGALDRISLDRLILEQFQEAAAARGASQIEIVNATAGGMNTALLADGVAAPESADADAVINVQMQPGAACSAGKDNLSLGIDVRVYRARDRELLLAKSITGGTRFQRTVAVDNPLQYMPVYQRWIKPEAGPLYQAVAEALYRTAM